MRSRRFSRLAQPCSGTSVQAGQARAGPPVMGEQGCSSSRIAHAGLPQGGTFPSSIAVL